MMASKQTRRSNGSGQVWQANGKWRGRIHAAGRYRTTSGATRREVVDRLAEIRAAAVKGAPAPRTGNATVSELFELWIVDCVNRVRAGDMSAKTLSNYAGAMERWILPHFGNTRIDRLRPHEVKDWQHRLTASGLAPASVATAHRVLRAAISFGLRNSYIAGENVARVAGGPSGVTNRSDRLAGEEAMTIAEALTGDERVHVVVALGLCGLRRGEIAGASWSDLDPSGQVLNVERALATNSGRLSLVKVKSDASNRPVFLTSLAQAVLERWRQVQESRRGHGSGRGAQLVDAGLIVTTDAGGAVDPDRLSREVAAFMRQTIGRPVSPHILRHTTASLLVDGGVGIEHVAAVLGHADSRVTARVYTHPGDAAKRAAVSVLDALLSGAKSDVRADPGR